MELIFKNKRKITGENYKELAPIYLAQMAICATAGFGKEYNTAEHLLEQCGDGNIEDGYALLFDVVDTNDQDKILYDCWLYLFDETANVFFTGTTNDVNVGMSQSFFEDYTDGKNTQLTEALQKAYNKIF